MSYNRCGYNDVAECSCATRFCVNRVVAILAIALALLVGAILGTFLASTFIQAIIPLIIFAVGILLAIVLIYVFFGCRCKRFTDE